MRFKYAGYACVIMLLLAAVAAKAEDIVIKSPANRGETDIGDYQLAEDFAKGFEALGKSVAIDYRDEYHKHHTPEPELNIFMRGYTKFTPPYPEGVNVLYVYYPMAYTAASAYKRDKKALNALKAEPEDSSLYDDWQNFDILAVASLSYTKALNDNGIKAFYVPQFTNPKKFYPAPEKDLKTDILFVGSNWHDRTSLRYALESGFSVAVYGYNWQGSVPETMYKAPHIPNNELHRYYSSAKIVLNDHRPDMKELGFINNRIYDATASGTLVISDYMPEIEAVYGDSVPMYRTKEELAELLNYYLKNENKRQELAAKARAITLENFTAEAAAKQVLSVMAEKSE